MKKISTLILLALLAFGQTAWAQQTNVNYIDANGEPQTASAYLITSSNTTLGMQGYDIWYYVEGNVEINSQVTYISNINLILCDGASLTVNSTDEDAIHCSAVNSTLTIYGQTYGTGQLTATATSGSGIYTEYFTINGGVINASGSSNGIYANKTLVINRGTVTANGNDWGMCGDVVTINGGNVTANGGGIWSSGMTSTLTIGYTNSSDRIYSTKYQSGYTGNMMKVKSGQYMKTTDTNFIIYGKVNDDWKDAIAGHTLMPYTPTEWSGSGTAQSPYIISSVDDLNLLSIRTNGGTHPYSDTCFKLGANITYSPSTTWNDASSTEHNFTAIAGFDGHFDGDGHTISGLRIYVNDNYHDQNGLFTNLGPNAYIERLTISNTRIAGQTQVGAIAGYVNNGATVTNCHVTGNVAVHAKGHTLENHGGIVGINYGTISNCVSEATISRGSYANDNGKAGGIAGANSGTLSSNKVFNVNITAGSHYGAIAGLNDGGTLTNNYYHACTINGTTNATGVGCNGADVTTGDGAMSIHTITKPNDVTINTEPTLVYGGTNYWKHGTTITLSGGLGGTPTAGWQNAYFVNNVANTSDPFTPSNTFPITPARDIEITIGEIHGDWANEYNNSTAGNSSDNPYKIYFTDQLDLLATRVNAGTTYSGKYFKLMNNLAYDNTEQNNYTAIGNSSHSFSGHFNGDSKVISGIRISGSNSYQGVFGAIANASITNLTVADAVINGNSPIGVIVGSKNGGTLTNNYYLDCSINSATTGIGCNGADVEGAQPVFTISVANGITASATPTVTYNTVNYYKEGVTITLSGGLDSSTPSPGKQNVYSVYGEPLLTSGLTPTNTFNMQAANAVVTVVEVPADWAAEAGAGSSEANPYKIYYTEQLDLLATRVNSGTDYAGKYFKLMDDLTYSYSNLGENGSNYTAIGKVNKPFNGHFDGNNKTISGIRIYKSGTDTTDDSYQAVFGCLNDINSEVKNLTVADVDITAYEHAAGIVGVLNGGTVTNCHATSTVFIRSIRRSAHYLGGIVGRADAYSNLTSTISHCTSSATLTATDLYYSFFGGIVGKIDGGVTVSDNFVIGVSVPACANNNHGAIVGTNNFSTLTNNYYHNCKVASQNITPSGVGCNGGDVTTDDGAMPVFTLSVAEDITADVDTTLIQDEVNYYKLGTTVSLSYITPADPGCRHIYSVNGTPIPNHDTCFNMNANSVVTITLNQLIDFEEHQGTAADPYLIYNAEQWNQFATRVNGGNTYSGKFFKLMEDISVTTMVGTHPGGNTYNTFGGTFDGDDHTITVNYTTNDEFCGPFCYTYGATIKNLATDGTINTSNTHAGGVVGRNGTGNLTMTNVKSSVTINSTYNGSAQHGGLVGYVINGTLEGCAFTGQLLGSSSHHCGGLVGWKTNTDGSRLTLNHCIFNPSQVTVGTSGSKPFVVDNGVIDDNNCYYFSTALGTSQGKRGRIITGGTDVVVAFAGSGNVYDVSGISGYDVGIVYDSVLYAGKSESVQVDLTYTGSIPAHTSPVYTVTNGSLSGITLTLNNSNDAAVTISYDHYETDNWSGTGTEDDPYLIYTEGQWILLADRVSNEDNPNSYSGKYFKLMEDISINENHDTYQNPYPKLVGYGERSFQGTFDGNGHTIVLSYKNKSYQYEQAIALFPSVKNATIKRLTVDGYIYRDVCPHGIAGIVGSSYGTTNLISCRSSVDVQNDGDISPYNANGGGLVAYVESGTLNMINCVFDGRLEGRSHTSTYAHLWGGMINYVRDGATANLINCLFNPEDIKFWDPGATATFARKHDNATVNLTNCYYKNGELGTTQGTSAIGWEAEQLLDALGYAWEYTSPAVFQPIMQPQTFTGEGSEGSPYQIATAEDWDKLATYVAHQDSHSSDHFQMTGDISTTSMVGLFDNLTFKGTFDGGGNTLTVNYEVTSMPDKEISTAAPFAFVENATITDLHTTGSITTAGMRPAGVAGFVVGNSSITNCKSEVTLTSSHNDDIDAGGFVARVNKNKSITLTGCLFTGSITYSNPTGYEGGGMVGWTQEGASATLTNCVFAPSAINITKFVTNNDDKKHRMFVGGKRDHVTLSNCYYNGVAAATSMTPEGTRVYDIIPEHPVTVQLLGVATDYMVSGITIYGTGDKGLKFDDMCYAASGSSLDLELGVEAGYMVSAYYANETELTPNSGYYPDSYALTMPNVDVVITANATLVSVFREIEGYGESEEIGWAFIASPIAGSIVPDAVTNLIGNAIPETNPVVYDFDLYRFNPLVDLEWENYHRHNTTEAPFMLVNGMGYLYATKETKTLAFSGTFNTGASMDVTGLPQGFNLVGNPFTVDAYVNKSYYTLNSDGSAIVAKDSNEDQKIPPCYGVIVEVNGSETVTFNKTGQFSAGPNNGGLNVALTQANTRSNAVMDNAIISFNEGSELGKFYFGTQNANIYIPQGGKDYAIAFSEGQGEVPVNFKAKENGVYTISVNPEGVEMGYLHLIDNMTGNDIDLLAGASTGSATYTFTAKTTDYESRFKLVFASVCEDADGDNDNFAFYSNGNWIISNDGKAILQVIDVNGRVLSNEQINGSVSKAISGAAGVYVLRLINGNDVKTQKIVVM